MSDWRAGLAWALAVGLMMAAPRHAPAHVNPWPDTRRMRDRGAPATTRVGTLELTHCAHGALCGRLERPLDSSRAPGAIRAAGAGADTIAVYFEFYPHSKPVKSQGTLVATEGGPGYPATLSRDEYLALFKPLMDVRDVVIMDNRGTGQSGAIDCRELQTGDHWTVESVAQCGESLGERAALYGSADAADDLEAILSALGVGKIDLYGDSYGTYFEQVFAVRHPARLRSIVLDGAYPLGGGDYAWYPTYAPAMRDKFNLACARVPGCAGLPGSSVDHVLPALADLRTTPVVARAHDIDGKLREIRADAAQLAIVMYSSAPKLTTLREVDAAARAYHAGDRVPLLRLMAETAAAVDSRDPTADATQWSAGLAAAVMCHDPPQIFDMRLAPAERTRDRDRALAERRAAHPDTYAPFSIDEYRAMPLDYSFLDQCVGWPVAPPNHPASQVGAGAVYPQVPALVISGELDNITTVADGAAVAAAFPHGVQIRVANSLHVNALLHAHNDCARDIVRRFMGTLQVGDTACAAAIPPVPVLTRFAMHAGELTPALALPGNQANDAQLRMVAAAVLTVQDVAARIIYNTSGRGDGLRGGTYVVSRPRPLAHSGDASADAAVVQLHDVHWTDDVTVSGRVAVPKANRITRATLVVAGTDGVSGRLRIEWTTAALTTGRVAITGSLAGRRVRAETTP
jgi:pimeloyl-ACP methyl ester carboxylesterase